MKRIFTFLSVAFCALVLSTSANARYFNHAHQLLSPPTTLATNISVSSIDGDRAYIGWTNGNGAKRLVIVSRDSIVSAFPTNGVTYTPNVVFGLGNEIKPGQFVVFADSYNGLNMSGLTPAHTYNIAIFEYNVTNGVTEYNPTPTRGSFQTLSAPALQVSNLTASNINGNSMRLNWTNGNGSRRLILGRKGGPVNVNPTDLIAYTSGSFASPGSKIGADVYVLSWTANNYADITSLEPATTYYFAVYECNGFFGPVYLTSSPATGSFTTDARPSIAASKLSFNTIEGSSFNLSFTQGNGTKRLIVARAGSAVDVAPTDGTVYNANTAFGKGDSLAPGQYILYTDVYGNVNVTNLKPFTTYYFRVYEYDGTGTNTHYLTSSFASGSQGTANAPAQAASNITVTNIQSTQATVSWTNGDGQRRLLVAKEGSPVNTFPADLTFYGNATAIANGNFIVANTTSNSVIMNGLSPNKTYYLTVIEENGFSAPVYNNVNPPVANFSTTIKPTVASSAMTFSSIEGNSFNCSWTSGNGAKRIVIAREGQPVTAVPVDGQSYAANTTFKSGAQIAPGQYVVFNDTYSGFTLGGLTPNTTYYFAVYDYAIDGTNNYYLTSQFLAGSKSTAITPSTPASNLVISSVTSNTITLTCTPGSGDRRLFIMKASSPVDATLNDLAFNGSSQNLGNGNLVISNTSSNSATATGLIPNTKYYFAVVETNGFTAPVYQQTQKLTGSATTEARPTVEAKNGAFSYIEGNSMQLSWTVGNGTNRLVIAKKGAAVTAVPTDGITYAANDTFGKGYQIAPNEFVVANTNSWNTVIKGLDTSATYYFAVFENDGTGSNIGYLTAKCLTANQNTLSAPTVQASNPLYSNITSTTVTLNWTNGNGTNRMVIARKGSSVTAVPQSLKSYYYSANFGLQAITPGNFVVYSSNDNKANIIGLETGTTYYYSVYEYNGSSAPVYQTANPATGTFTTLGAPTVSADSMYFTNFDPTGSVQINWKNGSGQKRIVIAKEATATDFIPVDTKTYNANSFFGSGELVGNNNYVVYNGISDHVLITNLSKSKVYYFTVFEYNQFPTGPSYKTTAPATMSLDMITLPVKWIDFNYTLHNNSVQLNWAIEERDNSHFEIETSNDGIKFTMIASVNSKGNGRNTYNYLTNLNNGINYYRVKQVDKDGKSSYSKVITINTLKQGSVTLLQSVVTSQLSVDITSSATSMALIITDISGKQILKAAALQGTNRLNVSNLASGIYLLSIVKENQVVETLRFLKQ